MEEEVAWKTLYLFSKITLFTKCLFASSFDCIQSIHNRTFTWFEWFKSLTDGHRHHLPHQLLSVNLLSLIGNTPLINLSSLSEYTGCTILAKLEYLNPGGSPKDRFVKRFLDQLKNEGRLNDPSMEIVEATTGSTGISLALLCKFYGIGCTIFTPLDQSEEKRLWMRLYGAKVITVPPASYNNPEHYVKRAVRYVHDNPTTSIYLDQFENETNWLSHYESTGPEIWNQTKGSLDAIVMAAGTAGTLVGVSKYLKEKSNNRIKVFVPDPPGSGLYTYFMHGLLFANEELEGSRRRHQVDSIVQGVGMNRMTKILSLAQADYAFKITDRETQFMSRYLLSHEGLFVGSSAALNVVGAVKAARLLGPGHTIVTVIPDAGYRHWSTFWNEETKILNEKEKDVFETNNSNDLHFSSTSTDSLDFIL